MSDQKLRELERRWKETGSPDDEAAYLLERARTGDLHVERLRLAAYLEHEVCKSALGLHAQAASEDPEHYWIAHLVDFGNETCLRAGIAIAWRVSDAWRRHGAHHTHEANGGLDSAIMEVQPLLDPVIHASEAFVLDTSDVRGRELEAAGEALWAAWQVAYDALPDELEIIRRRVAVTAKDEPYGLIASARSVAELPRLAVADETRPGAVGLGLTRDRAAGELSTSLLRLSMSLDFQISGFTYIQAVRSELLPWALGTGDPVRSRVESRARVMGKP